MEIDVELLRTDPDYAGFIAARRGLEPRKGRSFELIKLACECYPPKGYPWDSTSNPTGELQCPWMIVERSIPRCNKDGGICLLQISTRWCPYYESWLKALIREWGNWYLNHFEEYLDVLLKGLKKKWGDWYARYEKALED